MRPADADHRKELRGFQSWGFEGTSVPRDLRHPEAKVHPDDGRDGCYNDKGDEAKDADDHDDRGGSDVSVRKCLRETLLDGGGEPSVTHVVASKPSDVGVMMTTVAGDKSGTHILMTVLQKSQAGLWLPFA